jgi:hypothetical protein
MGKSKRMRKRNILESMGRAACLAIAAAGGAIVAGWAAYATIAWIGYGRLGVDRHRDPLLDRFIPAYEIGERHEIRVAAPADVAYASACAFDLQQSPVIRAIFRGRELILGAPHDDALPAGLLVQMRGLGWGVLADEPGHEIVMGAVTQPWQRRVKFRALPPDAFAGFDSPGYVKIVWTIEAEPLGSSTSLLRTMTRVQATDADSRRKLRRYWSVFSPGILLIRRESLRIIRDDAECRYDGASSPVSLM